MNNLSEEINNIEQETNLRLTSQREAVLKILIQNEGEHLSVEDIFTLLQEQNNPVGISTIYRTLDLFTEEGIVTKRNFGDGSARYEYTWQKENRHYHLICKQCGRVIETEGLLIEDLAEKLLAEEGFEVVDCCIRVEGYCKECR